VIRRRAHVLAVPSRLPGRRRLAVWAAVAIVCVVSAVPYVPTLHSYFLADDFGVIQLLSNKPTFHFLSLFTRTWTEDIYAEPSVDELRPLLAVSFQFNSLWGPASPTAYHATNILFHLANTLLVFAIARVIVRVGVVAATLSSILFAVSIVHAEAVAWINGRADSLPALLYVGAFFTYALWNRTKSRVFYAASIFLLFLALFTKQSAITFLASIVAYDALIARRTLRPSWLEFGRYVPFVLMTGMYLVLRYTLFGQVVRENQLSVDRILQLGSIQLVFIRMLVSESPLFSPTSLAPRLQLVLAILTLLVISPVVYLNFRARSLRALLYFGPVWWLISTLPLLVTYETPRHLYVAVVGLAVAVGGILDRLLTTSGEKLVKLRIAAVVLGSGAVIAAYMGNLTQSVHEWTTAGAAAEKMVRDVELRLPSYPDGSLIILAFPQTDSAQNLMSFAMPFAVQPPFTKMDMTRQWFIVEPKWSYCCPRQWHADVQAAVAGWSSQPTQKPAAMFAWDRAGAMVYGSELDQPSLGHLSMSLVAARTAGELCTQLNVILQQADVGGTTMCELYQQQ
jgi:hypothetical protein